ncbi:heavy metal-associated domain-containing protein [Brevibacillus sp. FSL K6-0770]|jgi:copper chaperone|uniref:HMA domain-containing protein n=1 Tax=Brevibacillus parabrevis TaxID=54914 RepID=A0A4Y3PFF9_BREPA|nr:MULTISPECIES: heavy metal-associated domain-containing protein [Brevibacillus]MBU8711857.1 heavy-metal-associated domain-containing protein [Brevibacillus parabrevis]MED2257804.1 heavy metal-associated domain-containing protein [Brevibacillus parabrevis]NRQ51876.1 heavy-metal-associated domain-containing protein [Brevibacillus sp. HD1.4A]RNB93517.1 heavy-metal-associated domain-containing protein [Brevibacillus parabrevis]GEB31455.1 hypothetical protein BPA01_10350 [Brevibacillus parabrevis
MHTEKIPVQGMRDEQDAQKVNDALHNVWGIRQAEVSLAKGEALVSYDEKAASLIDFQQAIRDLGYEVALK